MPHDIIDNREEKLADHIGRLLDNAERAKFAVGYFFLSGFKEIRAHLEKVQELRLLIGSTSNLKTVEALALGTGNPEVVEKLLEPLNYLTPQEKAEAVKRESEKLTEIAAQIPQTDEDEEYIKFLAKLVKDGKIKVRVYTKGVLHAKAYIVDYPKDRYERGSAIVGSSNLSLAGVTSNTELNVVVPGNENHEKLSEWFERLWNDAEDFDKELMHVLESSWAMNEPTPYELYLKVVYELVKDRLDEDEKLHKPKGLEVPELYDYQKDAVIQARSILRDYDGVFLADVVGLGKTYMGAALLADIYARTGEKAVIICPPVLKPLWQDVCDMYDLPVRIFSRAKVHDILEDERLMARPVVLIDESHHFRHPYTKSYKAVEEVCYRKKVIMLTATPYNTEPSDILNQMRLFHPTKATVIPVDPPVLTDFFSLVEKGEKKLPELLEYVMVRRTRRHIEKYYKEDMQSGKLKFPERKPPVRIDYSIDDVYPGIYDKIERALKRIRYARYDLFHYVKPEFRGEADLAQLKTAGKNLVALMRTILFKRLESSVAAFTRSVKDQEEIHQLYLDYLKKGVVPAGLLAEELKRYRRTGDDERMEQAMETFSEKYGAEKFNLERLKEDIEADLSVFAEIYKMVKDLKPEDDEKLQTLLKYLEEQPFKGSKVLVFTQFATTAEYLGEQVTKRFSQAEYVSGSSTDLLDKIKRFAPKANRAKVKAKDEIRVLVTTDILSEGLNLQDGNIVVSYDLHWNPVRLIQRIGRVDRVSTVHDVIHTFNFFPERKLEAKLGLEKRLTRRFDDIHKHIGLGEKYLSPDEKLTDIELFTRMYTGDESVLVESDEEAEVSFAELVKIMRDLREKDAKLYARITSLPNKVRSARANDEDEMIVFCKAGDYSALYMADEEGKITSRDQMDILKKLKCDPKTKRVALPRDFNAKVRTIEREFQEDAQERVLQRDAVESEPLVRQTLKELNSLARKVKGEDKKTITELRSRLVRAPLSPKEKKGLRSLRRMQNTPEEHVRALKELLLSQQTLGFEEEVSKEKRREPVVVQVIASEALVKKDS